MSVTLSPVNSPVATRTPPTSIGPKGCRLNRSMPVVASKTRTVPGRPGPDPTATMESLGITGTAAPDTAAVARAVARLKRSTTLPVCVGFGVKTAEQAGAIGRVADGVVVGSALVNAVRDSLDERGRATGATVRAVSALVEDLARGVRQARLAAAE